jgi:hypothetical protein
MTRDDVIRMAREADKEGDLLWLDQRIDGYKEEVEFIERFAALVAAAEREACAKVCDKVKTEAEEAAGGYKAQEDWYSIGTAKQCAEAIRARGQT